MKPKTPPYKQRLKEYCAENSMVYQFYKWIEKKTKQRNRGDLCYKCRKNQAECKQNGKQLCLECLQKNGRGLINQNE